MASGGGRAAVVDEAETKFVESGERDRLKELLARRLSESGWSQEVQEKCRDVIRERGVENVTSDELVSEVTPVARRLVPDAVKRELLDQIRDFLQQQAGINDI